MKRTRLHLLTDIITISLLAFIAGAEGWLETFLELPEEIPSPDTFRRVFERINPKEFEQCFRNWVQSLVEKLGVEV
ncbi:transposase family protein [Anabaena sp. UHCC 0451]|uniref:transposase family protein n=1 Tax=Anabaena sp. UHCC 0451 TaxID=2055235 RepID=UPI003A4C803A